MIIGADYPLIELQLFGFEFLEPNALIGDFILFIVAVALGLQINRRFPKTDFYRFWKYFFILFGFNFLLGGLGHFLFNYTGVPGKYPAWYLGIISVYFIERAMVSLHPSSYFKSIVKKVSLIKMVLAFLGATAVFALLDLEKDPSIGLKVPSLNTFIGLVFSLGYLGFTYMKLYTKSFRYLIISVFVLIPTAVVQTLKISFAQWFDRNDISHIFLLCALILYYLGVRGYYLSTNSKHA